MSEFLEGLTEAHAELDEMDPSVLEIHGVTPAGGVTATSWPLDGAVVSTGGNQMQTIDSRVSVIRTKLTGGTPEPGMIATLDGSTYTIGGVRSDSVAFELDLVDPRKL